MLQSVRLVLILALLMNVISCSRIYGENGIIKNRDTDYLKAHTIEPLKIPPGYSSSGMASNYPVSSQQYPENAKTVSLTPPGLYTSGK